MISKVKPRLLGRYFIFFIAIALGSVIPSYAENVQIRVELNGSASGNPVIRSLKGKTYLTNGWFDEMATGSLSSDEKFLIDAVKVNTNGKLSDVKKLWTLDEQNTSFFSDPKVFARSQSIFKRITSAAFLAKIIYGNYVIFIVQFNVEGYGTMVNQYPLKKQGGKFYFTNELMKDPVYHYLHDKYAKTLPIKQR